MNETESRGIIPPPIRFRATLIFDDEVRVIEGELPDFIGPIHPRYIKRGRVYIQPSPFFELIKPQIW